jgi:hypothetical protein
MEFWPLIKVVRIYTKAEALSTGAVIVDLPGVHDSNAARAAVAAGKKNLHLHVCLQKWSRFSFQIRYLCPQAVWGL